MEQKNRFEMLNAINVSDHIEKKNDLSYLSWAWAWTEFKKRFPESYYTIYEHDNIPYFTDGKTCWVKTGVTLVDGDFKLEHIEYLPVMDFKNRSISVDAITSMDMNKTIQRSLTKAVARHGLGCYIYAGEDLPEELPEAKAAREKAEAEAKAIIEALKGEIDAQIKEQTKGFNRDQKVEFAQSIILPNIGQVNYKVCDDKAKLEQLLKVLVERTAKPAA